MSKEHKLYLGKCDGYGNGRKMCKAFITWSLDDKDGKGPCFSMQAEIWNTRETDIIRGGQCVDDVVALFPGNEKAARMVEVWKRYHLNNMTAGSPAQEAYLKLNPIPLEEYAYPKSHYDVACEKLRLAGLNPDTSYEYQKPNAHGAAVRGYEYGSAWLYGPIPEDVLNEIRSW